MHFLSRPPAQWIVKTSGVESLIEIPNWLVGWSRMVAPRFDQQTYNQDRARASGQQRKTKKNYRIDYLGKIHCEILKSNHRILKFNLLFCDERFDCEMGSRHPRNSLSLTKMRRRRRRRLATAAAATNFQLDWTILKMASSTAPSLHPFCITGDLHFCNLHIEISSPANFQPDPS